MKKLLVFHRIIAPYRIDLFNSLSAHYDAKFCLFQRNLSSQKFDYSKIESQFSFSPKYIVQSELGMIKWMVALWHQLSSTKPEIVLVNEFGVCTIVTLLHRMLTFGKYRVVSIVDDSYNMVADDNQFTKRHKRAMNLLAPRLDDIINVEPKVTEWYQQKFGKGVYFPIICDDTIARERQKQVLSISEEYVKKYALEGKKVLLFVGRLVELKNVDFAVKAFIKANLKDTVFVIVGDGPERKKIEELVIGLDNIIITGRLEGENLYAWYNVANILTLQSFQEAFGAVTNEALVSGCKALVSRKAGSNCLVKDGVNGYVIEPNDEDDYIDKLSRLMNDEKPLRVPLHQKGNLMLESFEESFKRILNCLG